MTPLCHEDTLQRKQNCLSKRSPSSTLGRAESRSFERCAPAAAQVLPTARGTSAESTTGNRKATCTSQRSAALGTARCRGKRCSQASWRANRRLGLRIYEKPACHTRSSCLIVYWAEKMGSLTPGPRSSWLGHSDRAPFCGSRAQIWGWPSV